MSSVTPVFCDECIAAKKVAMYSNVDALKFEMRIVYTYPWDIMEAYCVHAFRRLKLRETNLEMLERKFEEKINETL